MIIISGLDCYSSNIIIRIFCNFKNNTCFLIVSLYQHMTVQFHNPSFIVKYLSAVSCWWLMLYLQNVLTLSLREFPNISQYLQGPENSGYESFVWKHSPYILIKLLNPHRVGCNRLYTVTVAIAKLETS